MASEPVYVCVMMDPLPEDGPLPGFLDEERLNSCILKTVYKVFTTRGAIHDLASEDGLTEIEHVEGYAAFSRGLFLRPQRFIEEVVSNTIAGIPPTIRNTVVEQITYGEISMAYSYEVVYQAIAYIYVKVSNWDGNEPSLLNWRWLPAVDTDEDRAVAESYEAYEYRVCPASASAIDALERRKFSGEEEFGCIICMEDLEVGSLMLKMPCKRAFHESCLLKWLSQDHVCPLCRFQLPKKA